MSDANEPVAFEIEPGQSPSLLPYAVAWATGVAFTMVGALAVAALGGLDIMVPHEEGPPKAEMQADLAALQSRYDALQAKSDQQQAANEQMADASNQVLVLQDQVAEKQAEVDKLNQQVAEEQGDKAALRQKLRQKVAELADLKQRLAATVAEKERLQGDLVISQQETADAQAATADATVRAASLESSLASTQWSDFRSQVALDICDRGTHKRVNRCRDEVSAALDAQRGERFKYCVQTQQATPQLRKAENKDSKPPAFSEWVNQGSDFTKNKYYIVFCDPTLPESGGT